MDYDKLIEDFKQLEFVAYNYNINGEVFGMDCTDFENIMADAATALSTLQAENEKLKADLARVTAERGAAVSDISSVLAEVEEIRRGYGVDNADADNAFANLCGNYCAKCGDNCYQEAENYRCKNYEWRGIKGEG